jgi:hypothetical protein
MTRSAVKVKNRDLVAGAEPAQKSLVPFGDAVTA